MRRLLIPAILFLAAAGDAPSITVTHPWARASAGAATAGAAYLTLTDTGAPDKLVSASTPVASTAQVHETINDHGTMKMRPVDGGLALPTGKAVSLSPGGYHVMLIGLKSPLRAGTSFRMKLKFEKAGAIDVDVHVEAAGANPAMKP